VAKLFNLIYYLIFTPTITLNTSAYHQIKCVSMNVTYCSLKYFFWLNRHSVIFIMGIYIYTYHTRYNLLYISKAHTKLFLVLEGDYVQASELNKPYIKLAINM